MAEGVWFVSGATAGGQVREDDRGQAHDLGRRPAELAQRLFL
jgi:hypothetical protein